MSRSSESERERAIVWQWSRKGLSDGLVSRSLRRWPVCASTRLGSASATLRYVLRGGISIAVVSQFTVDSEREGERGRKGKVDEYEAITTSTPSGSSLGPRRRCSSPTEAEREALRLLMGRMRRAHGLENFARPPAPPYGPSRNSICIASTSNISTDHR